MSKDKEATKAAISVAEVEKKGGDLMYLGPTITGVVKRGTVFKDGILPKRAQEYITEFPQMERLFVKVDNAPEAVKELRKKQGVLSAVYDQVAAHFNTVGANAQNRRG